LNLNGSILASGSSNGCVFVYNFSTSKLIQKFEIFTKYFVQPCMDVKFQPINSDNKNILAASSWNGMIRIFDF
jgi:WD40 repeat protein